MSELYARLAAWADAGLLPRPFAYAFFVRGLIAVLLLAPLFGGLSHLIVARRLAFLSASLGHAAITGLALGLALGEPAASPWGGMYAFVGLFALGLVYLQRRSSLSPDTLIGVFLAMSLGLAICLLVVVTKRFDVHRIEAILFGSLLTVSDGDLLLLGLTVLVVGALLARSYNELVLDSVAPEIGPATTRAAFLDYLFVALLAAATVASLKIVGALLVEALAVIPAAAARQVARGTRGYILSSIGVALAAGCGGLFLSMQWPVPPGGAIVLCLAVLFFASFAVRRARA